jgi:hypothetical protein
MTANVYTRTSAESEREAALTIERTISTDLFHIVPDLDGAPGEIRTPDPLLRRNSWCFGT